MGDLVKYFKLWIGDYQRDTAHLSLAEHGAYQLMLQHYYATEKALPTGRELHRMLRAQEKEEREAVDRVAKQFWRETPDGLVNDRAIVEIARSSHKRDINLEIGKRGGRPRKTETVSKTKPNENRNGFENETETVSKTKPNENPIHSHSHSHSHSPIHSHSHKPDSPSPNNGEGENPVSPPAKPERARKRPIPHDFGISDAVRGWAAEHGYTDLQAHLEAFRNKAYAKGYQYANWDRAFMEAIRANWAGVGNAQAPAPKNGSNAWAANEAVRLFREGKHPYASSKPVPGVTVDGEVRRVG